MPTPPKLENATISEIKWDKQGKANPVPSGKKFKVQFNPQTLKVNLANQSSGGDQPQGSSKQFVGKGTTKLSMELWFDVALAQAQGRVGAGVKDVRNLTGEIAFFMATKEVSDNGKKNLVPPGLRFQWGSFLFDGILDSMDETLDLFSPDGEPLRAAVSISISKQEITYDARKAASLGNATPGSQPLMPAKAGQSVQQMAAEAGAKDWKKVAQANGIENPRMLAAGVLLNVNAGITVGGQLGISGGVSGGISGSVSAQASIGAEVRVGASAQLNAEVKVSGGFGGGV